MNVDITNMYAYMFFATGLGFLSFSGTASTDVLTKLNGCIVFNCSTEPGNSVSWHFNRHVYTVGTRINKKFADRENIALIGNHLIGEFNLRVCNITKLDEGEYSCISSAGLSSSEFSFDLRLMVSPRNMKIKNEIGGMIFAAKDQTVDLMCTVDQGIPHEKLVRVTGHKILANGTRRIGFNFTADRNKHLQLYTCRASHPALTQPLEKSVQFVLNQPPILHVITSPTQMIKNGHNISLLCELDHHIGLKMISWTQKNKTLTNRGTLLFLENVDKDREGLFCCHAKNKYGIGTSCTFITITDSEEAKDGNRSVSSSQIGFELQTISYPTALLCASTVLLASLAIYRYLKYDKNRYILNQEINNLDNTERLSTESNDRYEIIDESEISMYLEACGSSKNISEVSSLNGKENNFEIESGDLDTTDATEKQQSDPSSYQSLHIHTYNTNRKMKISEVCRKSSGKDDLCIHTDLHETSEKIVS